MPRKIQDDVWRRTTIRPRKTRSRRISSDQFRQLIAALADGHVNSFERFKVWRFGHDDVLEYPADRAHEAIANYDVQRIAGECHWRENDENQLTVEIDLWDGGNIAQLDRLFELSGAKNRVDQALSIIEDQVSRWPKTWHWPFHEQGLWATMCVVFGAVSIVWFLSIMKPTEPAGLEQLLRLIGALYLLVVCFIVLVRASWFVPFIWFYREGGAIEGRRGILPRLSLGLALVVATGLLTNLIWHGVFIFPQGNGEITSQ